MTIENGTGQTLHVHFSGPLSRTVVVPDGRSQSVELAVGEYQVAAEVPGSRIVPFYGRQAYQPFTHYWLKFYTQRAQLPQTPLRSEPRPEPPPTTSDLSSQRWELHVEPMRPAKDFWDVPLRLKNRHTQPTRFSTQYGDPDSFELTCESLTGTKTTARPFGFAFRGEIKLNAYLSTSVQPQQEISLRLIFSRNLPITTADGKDYGHCPADLKSATLRFSGLTVVFPRVTYASEAFIEGGNPSNRSQAGELKPQIRGSSEIDGLIQRMASCDRATCRVEAAAALSSVNDPRAADAVIAALSDSSDLVRGDVAKLLGERRMRSAVPALISRLTVEPRDWVTVQVVRALGKIGDRIALEPLERLRNATGSDYVRVQVEWALKHFGESAMFTDR